MSEPLVACSNCGRTFGRSRVSKHQAICRKSNRRRTTFDSGKQRAEGTDISLSATRKTFRPQKNGIPKTNWRERHREFISAIRNARKAVVAVRTGQPLPPPPPPAENPDYITCRSCYRRFNAQAAARHIPVCTNRRKEVGEPVSFAFRTIPTDYGSKNYYAKQYAKTVPKPTARPTILRRNVNNNVAQPYNANAVYEEEYEWPLPSGRSSASNSAVFPYNGCSTERIYQDQPNVLTNTGLSAAVLSGNRYRPHQRPGPGFIVGTRLQMKTTPQPQLSRSLPNTGPHRRSDNTQISRSLPTSRTTRCNARSKPTRSSLDSFKGTGRYFSATTRQKLLPARESRDESKNIAYSFGNMYVYDD